MQMPFREWTHWAAGYGLPRATLRLLARRGDPLARLLIDTNQGDNIYPLIEQVRGRGRMSRVVGRDGWVSADAQIVREVLRDGRFRTTKQQDRSPFRIVSWIMAKTDPGVLTGVEPPSMLVTDPPEHTRLRRVVSRAFTPRALDGLRTRIHDIADELLGRLQGRAECDLITEYTSRIPIAVIAEMLAIPRDETRDLHAIGESTTRLIATTAASWRDFRVAMKALREFDPYITAHIERLRHDDAADSVDERHLFIPLHDTALPAALSAGLTFGKALPSAPPPVPNYLDYLWLAPAYSPRVLLWSAEGWRNVPNT